MNQQLAIIQKRLTKMADDAHKAAGKAKTQYQKAQHRATATGLHEAWRLLEQAVKESRRPRRLGPLSEVIL